MYILFQNDYTQINRVFLELQRYTSTQILICDLYNKEYRS